MARLRDGARPRPLAIMRELSATLATCELTHLERAPIDVERARAQHRAYRDLLLELGWDVVTLAALEGHPDAVFVEDAAVVLDELAILCRPGAASRRGEVASVGRGLAPWRELREIEAPGTIDGGDVVVVGDRIWVGRTSRTNDAGVDQMRAIVEPRGYTVRTVSVRGCLHLKSAATRAGARHVVVNPEWTSPQAFDGLEVVTTDPSEPHGANVLTLGELVVTASAFPRTRARLEARGLLTRALDADELAKAEGALTCCSLLLAPSPAPGPSGPGG